MADLHITEKLVTMIDIEGADRLDPISVVLENFEPGKGRVTIRCYAQSWALNAYWGSMSGKSVEEFMMGCHPEYIMGCLTWGRQPVKKKDEAYFVRVVQAVQQALRQRAAAGVRVVPQPRHDDGSPAPEDNIAKAKRIMHCVDDYHAVPSEATRAALRGAILDELEAVARGVEGRVE